MTNQYPYDEEGIYTSRKSNPAKKGKTNVTSMKVIGVGGAGCNAINRMIEDGIRNVEFLAVNTDLQVLQNSLAQETMQIGTRLTRGLGAGAKPEIGEKAAQEDMEDIRAKLEGTDMVFITSGMGGGTGTGASPIFAKIAKEVGALTVGVVTMPFEWEGKKRYVAAEEGIEKLKEHVDTLLVISNSRIFKVIDPRTTLKNAFKRIDEVLKQAVEGISTIIGETGFINVDFADVRTILSNKGEAIMGIGVASGNDRSGSAARMALENPLIENSSFTNAGAILYNVVIGPDFGMRELDEASAVISSFCKDDSQIIFGVSIDENLKDKVKIIIVATEFQKIGQEKQSEPEPIPAEDIFVDRGKVVSLSERQRERNRETPHKFRVLSSEKDRSFGTNDNKRTEDFELPTYIRKRKMS
jgi:cell division protein FtsZ